MFGQTFYFQTIRKYVALFGTLFNDITISKQDSSNNIIQYIKVPITYAPKSKMLSRVEQDPNLDRPSASLPLPIMSFEMSNFYYDSDRKLNTIGKVVISDTDNRVLKYQYNPVPYNIEFRLYIYVKNSEDGTKIIEQILPYFTPDFTVTANLIPDLSERKDIPIVLTGINHEDNYSGDIKERRSIVWTLDFVLKGYLYGPIKKNSIILFANTVYYTPHVADGKLQSAVGLVDPVSFTHLQPGLTANGTPTSDAALSIPVNSILANSDFGYVISETDLDF